VQLTETSNRSYTDTITTAGAVTARWRVDAIDSAGAGSAWKYSDTMYLSSRNEPPVISGYDRHIGIKREGFTYDYTVLDPEHEDLVITERINGVMHREFSTVPGEEQQFEIMGNTFALLQNGDNTMTITAVDDSNNTESRVLTFDKQPPMISATYTTATPATTRPHRINILPRGQFPAGAIYEAYVTNNGNDDEPLWEDCTQAVFSRVAHVFSNERKTASTWGVNFKVMITRANAIEQDSCTLNGLAIQWE
jgi:hypothetical protein